MKKKDSDSSQEEIEADDNEVYVRQDLYVVFTHERELRNVDQVRIKISQFTGVVMRLKTITVPAMENLLAAIESDAFTFQQQQQANVMPMKTKVHSAPEEMSGLAEHNPVVTQTPTSGIINLRFEECVFTSKAVLLLKNFLYQKQLIETFFIQRVEFQEPIIDFRNLMEGIQFSIKIRKIGVLGMLFDEEPYGKIISHLLNDCRQLKEFDASNCEFFHPKCFFEMCQSLINEKSRLLILKLKGIHLSNLEGKVLQFVLMKNKTLHTIDMSYCKVDSGECLEFFLQKLDKYSNIKYLIMDNIQPDMSNCLEILGEALSENQKLEVLIMRENKMKWVPYSNFWDNIKGNTSLQKINISKTDLSDRVLEKMCQYLVNPELRLIDLDLSRNTITDIGLQNLSEALINQNSVKYLNLSQNQIRDQGLRYLVTYLSKPECALIELSLMGNKINNDGVILLADFIKPNVHLKMLDISKNLYQDVAFQTFAAEMGANATLTFLDISKSKELNDEGSLITLAKQLAFNTHLQTLDLTSVRVRKPFLKMYLEPSLQKNITLKYVLGKLTPDIIDEQLNINIQIRTDVEPNFQFHPRVYKVHLSPHQLANTFDCKTFDAENQSTLSMKGLPPSLFDASFKFMCQKDIRQLDLTDMDIQDGQLYQLANYLHTVPNLRSLVLNGNKQITDDGIIRIAHSLQKNNKIAHLSMTNCPLLSDECMNELLRSLTSFNMMMCFIEFDENNFSAALAQQVQRETVLNRAIQENLKPQFFSVPVSDSKKSKNNQSMESLKSSQTKFMHKDKDEPTTNNEIAFMEEAPVHKFLSSAIKCWRICQPVTIQIENQQLNDRHVAELCEFLKDRNMIHNLNLRRNQITNVGAQHLIDFMNNHDKALTHLDVSRNRITRAGAEAFLEALQRLTRIQDFQISYGNPIPLEVGLSIGYEVVANNQIKSNQEEFSRSANNMVNPKVTLTNSKYELIDRGPNYMRCAIKSVELLKIQHLSLPDNMLGLEEAKMLSQMIRVNPPLRTLNLEMNNLDAQCGQLIANALQQNDNLQLLNIRKNKLSDLGVTHLLQSLICSRMEQLATDKELQSLRKKNESGTEESKNSHDQNANMTMKPFKSPSRPGQQLSSPRKHTQSGQVLMQPSIQITTQNNTMENENLNSARSGASQIQIVIPTEEIEHVERGQLKVLNILDNQCTIESYKCIATILELNPKMVIYFDDPERLYEQQEKLDNNDLSSVGMQSHMSVSTSKVEPLSQSSSRAVSDNENPESNRLNIQVVDQQASQRSESEIAVKDAPKNRCVKCFVGCLSSIVSSCVGFSIQMCCYTRPILCCFRKNEIARKNHKPSLKMACCWHFYSYKKRVTQFDPKTEKKLKFNNKTLQNSMIAILMIHQVLIYFFSLLAFFMPHEREDEVTITDMMLLGFLFYLFIFENVLLILLRPFVKVNLCNPYLVFQLLLSLLNKQGLLCLGLISGRIFSNHTMPAMVVGCISILSVAVNQYKASRLVCSSIRQKENKLSLFDLIERTQNLIKILNYKGLLIAYDKISLQPTLHSKALSHKIAEEMNPDLVKAQKRGFSRFLEFVKNSYSENRHNRHMIHVDLLMLTLLIVGLAVGWLHFTIAVWLSFVFCAIDILSCFIQVKEDHNTKSQVSLQADEIYTKAQKKNAELDGRYVSVLMRDKDINSKLGTNADHTISLAAEDEHVKSEASLFETRNSQDNLGHSEIDIEKRVTMNAMSPDKGGEVDLSYTAIKKVGNDHSQLQLTQGDIPEDMITDPVK